MDTATDTLTWQDLLAKEKTTDHFQRAIHYVNSRRAAGITVYPKQADTFNAFKLTPFDKVKVVILGQDPYHGPRQAHGLAFSVMEGVRPPPSLLNIFKELHADTGFTIPNHGCLTHWAEQGVLLLNTSLTVEAGRAQSHGDIGWEIFTHNVIKTLNEHKEKLVFILWGSHAQKKAQLIDTRRHHILRAPHPSPLSAHRGFFGCKHFSKTNALLTKDGLEPIDWQL